jgi:hypothetical protein
MPPCGMDRTADDSLVLSIVMGLRNGLRLCHGMRRQLSEDEQFRIGRAILNHMRGSNYKIELGPPLSGHGQATDFRP